MISTKFGFGLNPKILTQYGLLQKHKGRLSGSLDVSNRGAMDRMMSTPLAAKERGITHRISKDRADFWKEEQNQPKDKKDNHTGLLTHSMPAIHCASHSQHACNTLCLLLTACLQYTVSQTHRNVTQECDTGMWLFLEDVLVQLQTLPSVTSNQNTCKIFSQCFCHLKQGTRQYFLGNLHLWLSLFQT